MAKRENLEMQGNLRSAIKTLLCEKGYAATSYQAIADEAGVTRTIVQYYYPRKLDMVIEFLNALLAACAQALSIDAYAKGKKLTPLEAYEIGSLYYSFLFSTEGTRLLFFDILKDRELADEMMEGHCTWLAERIGSDGLRTATLTNEQILALGGFYELMYQSLKYDRTFDVKKYLVPTMAPFVDAEAGIEILQASLENREDLAPLFARVEGILSDDLQVVTA